MSPETKERLIGAVERFPRCRILTVGDLMMDTFIWGDVRRISPEAPVPVVEVREETQLLGGAANVVHNVASMGGCVSVAGAIGADSAGRRMARLLQQISVSLDGLIIREDHPTTVKTRVIAQNQQVVRFDRETRTPLRSEALDRLFSYIRNNLAMIDGIIVSDYAKGMITAEFMDGLRNIVSASAGAVPVLVDPKVRNADLYRSVTMVTPNHNEAAKMAEMEIHDEESLVAAGKVLLDRLQCETVLITRGKQGMSLFQKNGETAHIPTVARRVYDVTGAGDTVIAALALGIVSGLRPVEAALLANLAAGIVVGEVGTATVSAEQLRAAFEDTC